VWDNANSTNNIKYHVGVSGQRFGDLSDWQFGLWLEIYSAAVVMCPIVSPERLFLPCPPLHGAPKRGGSGVGGERYTRWSRGAR